MVQQFKRVVCRLVDDWKTFELVITRHSSNDDEWLDASCDERGSREKKKKEQ